MTRRLLLALLALTMPLGLFLATVPPAAAAGDSGWRCVASDEYNFKVCAQVHTYASGGGYRVNSISLRSQREVAYFNPANDTHSNSSAVKTSNGTNVQAFGMDNTDMKPDPNWGSTLTIYNAQVGGQGCYVVTGLVGVATVDDPFYFISGNILGGACASQPASYLYFP